MKALHGYRVPRYARGHTALLTPNTLQRGFTVQRPNTVWVTDITYVRTWEGWLYLAVVMEPHRRLVNKAHHDPGICAERALHGSLSTQAEARPDSFRSRLAVWRDAWRRFCHAHHLESSMSRRGNYWEKAVAESFFSSLKKERIKKRIYKTRKMATAEINE